MPTTLSGRLAPVPFGDVTFDDTFWRPRLETNRTASIPHVYEQCQVTGRIDAFRLDWQPGDPNQPHIFWDSDVAKWLEGACYSLATHPDDELRARVDDVVDRIVGAQQPDGYLNLHFTVVEPEKRWTNLRDWHELYCAGHLMETAVAHHQLTGQSQLLDALCRYADYIDNVFGPQPHKRQGYPGHEEIELALVKLYRESGNARYLDLSRYFVDQRGQQPHFFDREAAARGEAPADFGPGGNWYNQSHLPVRQQSEAVGHAVRAMYLYSGMADLAAESGDADLLGACRRLWESATQRKMYITGGIGSHHRYENFGADYELPNESAYAETCASIGLVFFAHRLLQISGDSRYADVMERALYNNILAGVSLDGVKFFYVNPLTSAGDHHRQQFFRTSCCPPNLNRLLASFGQYVYSSSVDALYVHLFVGSEVETDMAGQAVTLRQRTRYPWDGKIEVELALAQPTPFDLMLRIPGWCRQHRLRVNGEDVEAPLRQGYAQLARRWQTGDTITLELEMPVVRMLAHPQVAAAAGKVALQRGPLVYCLEGCDHGVDVRTLVLPDDAELTARFDADLLGGVVVIEGRGARPLASAWSDRLYAPLDQIQTELVQLKAVPYAVWDNRQPGTMAVWLPRH